jgi:adenylate cyclase
MAEQQFVARQQELEQLDRFLNRALAAQGLVCFVTGEAGSGKTALVTEFARRAQKEHEDLVVAVGQSDAQTGSGDAYLPFREVLGQLTGDVEAKLAQGAITQENAGRLRQLLVLSGQALVEVGPDLVGIFVPGVGLATRVGAFVADKVGWLDRLEQLAGPSRQGTGQGATGIEQDHIFEQYTNVLTRLAEKQSLLIVLDDLQWADAASIGLLFRLGRRIGGSRILIVGTYRPEEVALGRPSASSGQAERHPLEKVLAELKRYHGDISVDLDRAQEVEGQGFVDAFLETEPNRLGADFRRALYQHTDGHPLFTIELLRDMQERGNLVQDEQGRWVESPALDWEALPVRVEGVIEERIGRLRAELREALTVASIEGEDFTAEVVARVQETNARDLIRQFSTEVAKRHRLVHAQGVRRTNGQRLSLYRFQHNLFQKYLYGEMGEAERSYLHEDVGLVLEALYGDEADQMAVQLAWHFEEAGLDEKATRYLRLAGEQAADRYANGEALRYFARALALMPEDGTTQRLAERYAILLACEKIHSVQGARDAQREDLAELEKIAEVLDDDAKRARVKLCHALYASEIGDFAATIAAAQAAIRQSEAAGYLQGEATGYRLWGVGLFYQGAYSEARGKLEIALARAGAADLPGERARLLRNLAAVFDLQGEDDAAQSSLEQALRICREIGDRQGEGYTLGNLGVLCLNQDNYADAEGYLQQDLDICRETGDRPGESIVLSNLGVLYSGQGNYARARACYEQALDINRETEDRRGEHHTLGNIGHVSIQFGDYARARDCFEHALPIAREIDDSVGASYILANLGWLSNNLRDHGAARQYSLEALQIAQETDNRETQSYALIALGNALAGLGNLADAADAFRQSLEMRREIGSQDRVMESLAGLARVSLAQGDHVQAREQIKEIVDHLQASTLPGADDPFRVYLTCYRVLQANGDPRAKEILTKTHTLLQERAAKIGDEGMRRSFLENVAAHREIVEEFERSALA